jgi:hypothetical protein
MELLWQTSPSSRSVILKSRTDTDPILPDWSPDEVIDRIERIEEAGTSVGISAEGLGNLFYVRRRDIGVGVSGWDYKRADVDGNRCRSTAPNILNVVCNGGWREEHLTLEELKQRLIKIMDTDFEITY